MSEAPPSKWSDPSYFIFEINFGKRWIRHRTTLKLNDEIEFPDRLKSIEDDVIQMQSRSIRLFPTFISKIKWLGSQLPLICRHVFSYIEISN